LRVLRASRYGENATIIGSIVAEPRARVLMQTSLGSTRVVDVLMGELLPRIC
jgi:hydrogenase expression/formation protein HypE